MAAGVRARVLRGALNLPHSMNALIIAFRVGHVGCQCVMVSKPRGRVVCPGEADCLFVIYSGTVSIHDDKVTFAIAGSSKRMSCQGAGELHRSGT